MALTEHVALVSISKTVTYSAVARASAAIQNQVTKDFGPIWGVEATVDSFEQLKDVPIGYWVVMIIDHDDRLPPTAGGVHLDKQGQPFALVRSGDGWEMTASHEVLEMLADPFGNRLVAGPSPAEGQGRVEFLVEVSDPSEAADCGYEVNGIMLSDFYTPHYFDAVTSTGVRYSFSGKIEEPRVVLPGGYLSWRDPATDEWFQWQYFETSTIVSLGKITMQGNLRATIERLTYAQSQAAVAALRNRGLTAARASVPQGDKGSEVRAKAFMDALESLRDDGHGDSPKKKTLRLRPRG
jgi:hypothetical protein